MSTSKRVYEGSDPNVLLKEILKEHGSSVDITKPELVRKGGVLGFFATSQYRVEVHPKARHIDHEHIPANIGAGIGSKAPGPTAQGTRGALESLAENTRDTLDLTLTPKTFDAVLDEVAGSLGEDPERFAESPLMTQAREYLARSNANTSTTTSTAPGTPRRFDPPTARESTSFLNDHQETPVEANGKPNAPSTSNHLPTHVAVTPKHRGIEHHQPSSPSSQRNAVATVHSSPARQGANDEQIVERLRSVLFPSRLLDVLDATDALRLSFEMAFSLIPPAPKLPRLPGTLIAVVGTPDAAFRYGSAVAKSLGLKGEDVTIARMTTPVKTTTKGARHDQIVLSDVKQAAVVAPGLRRDRTCVVVVEHNDTKASDVWTRNMLRALRPTATWAAVDARTKHTDIRCFVESIGGVDALMVEHLDRTATPCEILNNAIPIARLDGKLATPTAWAKVVAASTRTFGRVDLAND